MKRPSRTPLPSFLVELVGELQSVGVCLENRPQSRTLSINRIDALEVVLRQAPRGPFSRFQTPLELIDGRLIELRSRRRCLRTPRDGARQGSARQYRRAKETSACPLPFVLRH